MKKNILVTGSMGAAGLAVLNEVYLKMDKYNVTALYHQHGKKLIKKFEDKITFIHADILDKNKVNDITKSVDSVIHLVAIIPPLADENPALAYQVNTVGSKNLIEALEKNSPNAFFLYTSSISVYGDRVKTPYIKVSDPIQPSERDEYALTKIETEKILENSTLDWTVFRLTAMMGNHKMSKLMFHMPLDTAMELITPPIAAKALVNAIEKKEELSKRVFNFSGGEKMRLTYKELLNGSFEAFGMGKVNFPKHTFAEQNFHCGYYEDSNELEKILHFQTEDLTIYFQNLKKEVNPLQRAVTKPMSGIVKYFMKKQSEPLQAFKRKNEKELMHYFGTTQLN